MTEPTYCPTTLKRSYTEAEARAEAAAAPAKQGMAASRHYHCIYCGNWQCGHAMKSSRRQATGRRTMPRR